MVKRIEKTASFLALSGIEKVYPLFGPVREKEWATGWNPEVMYAVHPEVELHMIFKTPGRDPDEEYLWIVTQYRPEDYLIAYTVSADDRIWFITVKCDSLAENTRVSVTYSYTGWTVQANERNRQSLEEMFAHNLKDWEEAVNFYLVNGTRL